MSDDKHLTAQELWEILNKNKKAGIAPAPKVGISGPMPDNNAWNAWTAPYPVESLELAEVEDSEEEVILPTTCKFFAPNETAFENGAELPEAWPYNKPQNYHACTNPAFNKAGKFACEMINNQPACVGFSDTEPTIVKQLRFHKKGKYTEKQRVSMLKGRYGLSVPIYQIFATTANTDGIFEPDTERLLHTIDGAEHKKETLHVANALWEQVISEYDDYNSFDAMPEKPKPPSYLKDLIAV